MLVLSRKNRESIVTSNGLRITVLEIRRGKVKIGLDAPSSVRIDRLEVDQARKENPK